MRLLSQQLAGPRFTDARDAVEWMGMVQAQDYRMMRWAVGMRMKRPSMRAFREAFDAGRIVRMHLFRCTWQLVAAEDARWMLSLCAERNKKAIACYGREVTEQEYARASEVIGRVLEGQGPMSRETLAGRLAELGLRVNTRLISLYLRWAEQEGIVCSGVLGDRQNTYALMDERVPARGGIPREEAMALLARKYFRGHSPATVEDFAWWTGIGLGECRAAVGAIREELEEVSHEGRMYYAYRDGRARGGRERTLLLPPYDEYLLGYKSRQHVLEEAFGHRAHNRHGVFYPVIVREGQVVGNWHPRGETSFFREEYRVPVEEEMKRVQAFFRE